MSELDLSDININLDAPSAGWSGDVPSNDKPQGWTPDMGTGLVPSDPSLPPYSPILWFLDSEDPDDLSNLSSAFYQSGPTASGSLSSAFHFSDRLSTSDQTGSTDSGSLLSAFSLSAQLEASSEPDQIDRDFALFMDAQDVLRAIHGQNVQNSIFENEEAVANEEPAPRQEVFARPVTPSSPSTPPYSPLTIVGDFDSEEEFLTSSAPEPESNDDESGSAYISDSSDDDTDSEHAPRRRFVGGKRLPGTKRVSGDTSTAQDVLDFAEDDDDEADEADLETDNNTDVNEYAGDESDTSDGGPSSSTARPTTGGKSVEMLLKNNIKNILELETSADDKLAMIAALVGDNTNTKTTPPPAPRKAPRKSTSSYKYPSPTSTPAPFATNDAAVAAATPLKTSSARSTTALAAPTSKHMNKRKPATKTKDATRKPSIMMKWTEAERKEVNEILPGIISAGAVGEERFGKVADHLNKKFGDRYRKEHGTEAKRTNTSVKNQVNRVIRLMFKNGFDDRSARKDGRKREVVTSARENKKMEAKENLKRKRDEEEDAGDTEQDVDVARRYAPKKARKDGAKGT